MVTKKTVSYVVLAQTIRAEEGNYLSNKHHMQLIGETGGLADSVNILGLSYELQGPIEKEVLRNILVDSVDDFLAKINSNEQIRPFLKNYPFTPNEIEIVIYIHDQHGREPHDPIISLAAARNGYLNYRTVDSLNTYKYKTDIQEEYETARRIVMNQQSH